MMELLLRIKIGWSRTDWEDDFEQTAEGGERRKPLGYLRKWFQAAGSARSKGLRQEHIG